MVGKMLYAIVCEDVLHENVLILLLMPAAGGLPKLKWLVSDYKKAAYTPYEWFTCESQETPSD